ncbi:hypothetical protein TrST_g11023 [Triparma strigata]|uniref:CNH domain-containing protein n=1 Tax=Triparma strigata TaxID=1606541 RepID=A0A9W6ZC40_9STRA|nr:hypothetical protein TrST_g11023 [Triparma strigata]
MSNSNKTSSDQTITTPSAATITTETETKIAPPSRPRTSSSSSTASSGSTSSTPSPPLLRYSRLRTPTLPRLDDNAATALPTLDLSKTSPLKTSKFTQTSLLLFTETHLHECTINGETIERVRELPEGYTPAPDLNETGSTLRIPHKNVLYEYSLHSSQPPQKTIYPAPITVVHSTPSLLLLGLSTGVLLSSKTSWLGLRTTPLHTSSTPITTITSSSSHLLFSDHTSLKILNLTTLTPLASVTRPSGGNPSLHPPPLRPSIKPHCAFLTPSTVISAWGDCIMILSLTLTTCKCTKAFSLDGVCLGLTPLDVNYVLVLTGYIEDDGFELFDFETFENMDDEEISPFPEEIEGGKGEKPVMVVTGEEDVVVVRVRDTDDRIEECLKEGRVSEALRRGIWGRRRLKRYTISTLTHNYITHYLQINTLKSVALVASNLRPLLGASPTQWEKYLYLFVKTPLGLQNLLPLIPVRDPKLPPSLYEMVLEKLLLHVENDSPELEGDYLRFLRLWGTTEGLSKWCDIEQTEQSKKDLEYRYTQSAAEYLQPPSKSTPTTSPVRKREGSTSSQRSATSSLNSLFSLPSVSSRLKSRLTPSNKNKTSKRICLRALAYLSMLSKDTPAVISYFLDCAELEPDNQPEDLIMSNNLKANMSESNMYITFLRYLQINECVEEIKGDRIMKMIRLVGCDVAGGFFVEHCVSIETKATNTLTVKEVYTSLKDSPSSLLWFLTLIFVHKTELYLPTEKSTFINEMHREHLRLLVEAQSRWVRGRKERWKIAPSVEPPQPGDFESPLMTFLRTILANDKGGGIRSDDARNCIEKERRKSNNAYILPRELAYVLSTSANLPDAELCVKLYLENCSSVHLATLYASTHPTKKSHLWNIVVRWCLENDRLSNLLTSALLAGADLAKLVREIPDRAKIKNLKKLLLESIESYRSRMELVSVASQIGADDRDTLVQDLAKEERRGVRSEHLRVRMIDDDVKVVAKDRSMLGRSRKGRWSKRSLLV